MSEDRGPWMETFTGKRFYPLDPRCEDISIFDIAHALSNICRFGGHCKHYYSVAQHCIVGSDWIFKDRQSDRLAMLFLIHDAAEAYIGDMVRPLKTLKDLKLFRDIETIILYEAIYNYVGIDVPSRNERHIIEKFDNLMLCEEAFHLTMNKTLHWDNEYVEDQPEGHVNPDSLGEISRHAIEKMYLEDFFSLYSKLFDKLHKDDNIHTLKEDHAKET